MIRKFFASLLVFFFLVVSMPVYSLLGFYSTFGDEAVYGEEFVDIVYSIIVEELPERVDYDQFEVLDEEEVRDILLDVLEKEDVMDLSDEFIQQLKDVKADNGVLEMRVSFDWFTEKSDVISERVAKNLFSELPYCTDPGDYVDFNCIPEGIAEVDFVENVKIELDRLIFSDVPDELSFTVNIPEEVDGSVVDFLDHMAKRILLVGIVALALLLILIAILMFKPWCRLLKWTVKPFLLSSFVFLISLISMMFILSSEKFGATFGDFEFLADLLDYFSSTLVEHSLIFVLPVLIVSFILFIIGSVSYKKYKDNEPASIS